MSTSEEAIYINNLPEEDEGHPLTWEYGKYTGVYIDIGGVPRNIDNALGIVLVTDFCKIFSATPRIWTEESLTVLINNMLNIKRAIWRKKLREETGMVSLKPSPASNSVYTYKA